MRSAHAAWRPVAYQGLHARQPRRAALIHTNGGGTDHGSLWGWWTAGARGDHGRDNLHVGAQFQVMLNGHAEQYADSDLVLYHAYSASEWAFGIEVEDDSDPSRPMTDPQLTTIVAILREHNVPGHILTSPDPGDGVGWHELFPAWNKTGHRCPGAVREKQIRDEIIPALGVTAPHLTVKAANNGYFTVDWTRTPGATTYTVQVDHRVVWHTAKLEFNSGPLGRLHGQREIRVLATGPGVHVWSNIAVVPLP